MFSSEPPRQTSSLVNRLCLPQWNLGHTFPSQIKVPDENYVKYTYVFSTSIC